MKSINAEWRPGVAEKPAAGTRRALRIAVVGCGHGGLVTAACFASFGHVIVGVDTDAALVTRLSQGDLQDLHEPGLAEMVRAQAARRRLSFTADMAAAVRGASLVFVAVGVPARADGAIDTAAIDAVAAQLAAVLQPSVAVVIQSTVPAGTTQRVQARLDATPAGPRAAGTALVCPAFMRRGSALADFMAPARLLIGDDSPDDAARRLLLDACAPMLEAGAAVLTMDTRSAELVKPAANAMLAARISFMNEVAAIARATGADIEKVREGLGSDRRIGPACLQPGPGYGGPSLARDVAALRETARRHILRADLLLATERVNDRQRCWAFSALRRDFGTRAQLRSMRVAVWGLAFKPGTDDTRNAPSLVLIDRLVRAGVLVTLFDPAAIDGARRDIVEHRRIAWALTAEQALERADVLMLVTGWPEFVGFDPGIAARALRLRTVYDCRNSLDEARWSAAGLRVVQVGRATSPAAVLRSLTPEPGPAREGEPVEQPAQPSAAVRFPSDPFGLVS